MANGEWRMANGEWRMANGEWRMANFFNTDINVKPLFAIRHSLFAQHGGVLLKKNTLHGPRGSCRAWNAMPKRLAVQDNHALFAIRHSLFASLNLFYRLIHLQYERG